MAGYNAISWKWLSSNSKRSACGGRIKCGWLMRSTSASAIPARTTFYENTREPIQLLLTDVIMPDLTWAGSGTAAVHRAA